jgi:hypothetical protein
MNCRGIVPVTCTLPKEKEWWKGFSNPPTTYPLLYRFIDDSQFSVVLSLRRQAPPSVRETTPKRVPTYASLID